jgi:hypothetical protein
MTKIGSIPSRWMALMGNRPDRGCRPMEKPDAREPQ